MNVRVKIKTNWKNMQFSMIFRLRTLKNRSFRQVSSVWRHAFALYSFAMIGLLVYSLSSSVFSADLSSVAPPSCLCYIYFIFCLLIYINFGYGFFCRHSFLFFYSHFIYLFFCLFPFILFLLLIFSIIICSCFYSLLRPFFT